MLDPITLSLIMGGLGVAQGAGKQRAKDAAKQTKAAEIAYSPWTNMQSFTQIPDDGGGPLGLGLSGFLQGQEFGQQQEYNDWLKNFLSKGGYGMASNKSPYSQDESNYLNLQNERA